MTDTGKITEALVAFQAEMPVVSKAHTAKVPTKAGGSYSYTYAGLADVSAAAMPLLTKHGLAFSALPRRGDVGLELVGTLLHISGEKLEGALPIGGNTPQEIGSAITYARRYLFGCMTGLVTDDDDDGRAASSPAKKAARVTTATPDERWDAEPTPMQAGTRGAMFAEFNRLGIPEANQLAGINSITGQAYTSRGDLTDAHAKAVIADLKKRPTPQPVTA